MSRIFAIAFLGIAALVSLLGIAALVSSTTPDTPTRLADQTATQATAEPATTEEPASETTAKPAGTARTVLRDDGNGSGRTTTYRVVGKYEIRWTTRGSGYFGLTERGDDDYLEAPWPASSSSCELRRTHPTIK